MNDQEKRLSDLRKGYEVSLAIEGKYTNLRIWTGRDENGKHPPENHDTVFMRLDRANHYSAPLSSESYSYLEKPNEVIDKLLKFGFKCDINSVHNIIELTLSLKERACIAW